jgi:hypothetical protein
MQLIAYAGLDDGLAAAQKGDYQTALKEFKFLAEQGQADAQNNLGVMYEEGTGVAQDYVQTHKWFNLSSANGNAKAGEFERFSRSKNDSTTNLSRTRSS